MELGDLLRAPAVPAELRGDPAVQISDLAYDSRRAGPGTLLFCFPGERSDGHDFAAAAVEAGATAVVVQRPPAPAGPPAQVADARAAVAPVPPGFHGGPPAALAGVGITRTDGD